MTLSDIFMCCSFSSLAVGTELGLLQPEWRAFRLQTKEGSLGSNGSERHSLPEPEPEGRLWLASKRSLEHQTHHIVIVMDVKLSCTNNLASLLLRSPKPGDPLNSTPIQRGIDGSRIHSSLIEA